MANLKQPIPTPILIRCLLQTVQQVNKLDPGKATSTRWLITGGLAISRMIERETKDVDINARGALAPTLGGRSSILSEYLVQTPGLDARFKRRRNGEEEVVPHWGWCAMVEDRVEHIKVPYDYTWCPDDLDCHPQSRILSKITADDLPYANRDDMIFIKARSCLQRTMVEKRQKDAWDFTRLVRELKGPLLFEGHTDKAAQIMRDLVRKDLDDIVRLEGMSKGEFEDLLEL